MRQRQPRGADGLVDVLDLVRGIVELPGAQHVEHVVVELVVHGAGAQLQLLVFLVLRGRRRIELQQLVELVVRRGRRVQLQLFEPVQLFQLVVVAQRLGVPAAGAILGECRS